jgi:hypothetical protein
MSFRFEENPNLEEELKREVVSNLVDGNATAVGRLRCPDHPDFAFTVKADGDYWVVVSCCDKGQALAVEAIGKANK